MEQNSLAHAGVMGMKWGVRSSTGEGSGQSRSTNPQHAQSFHSPNELQNYMHKNIKYADFTKLKSPEQVMSTKSGSCHDQVMLELSSLKKMGLKPQAEFLIEYKPGVKCRRRNTFICSLSKRWKNNMDGECLEG